MLSEMCGVDPFTDVVWVCHSASMKQVHVGVSNTFIFARQHRLCQVVTMFFFFFFFARQYMFTLHSFSGARKGIFIEVDIVYGVNDSHWFIDK